ncbi:MAG TPA: M3 family metallopeptidase [Vitreimonas sp.]|nr:M3 family metallopeptidase [Vitreimonas sp.]
MNAARTTLLSAALLLSACATASSPPPADPTAGVDAFLSELHVAPASAADFTAYCETSYQRLDAMRDALERPGANTIEGAFAPFDALYKLGSSTYGEANLVTETNPNAEIRAAAEACQQRLSNFFTEVGLSRPIYDRLDAIDASAADADTRFALTRALEDYRRAGVDRDDATRARITALQNEITEISLAFARNIREDVDEVTFRSVDDLDGLPADYIAAHQPGADGLIRINTNTPDVFPVMNYATREETRRRVYIAYRNRAYPQNEAVLGDLLERRYELAGILGFENYADLVTADKMTGSSDRAQRFLDELAAAARPAAQRDYQRSLARLQRIDRRARVVPAWSASYVQQMIRREEYALDAQEVRAYFGYDDVRDGIFQLMTDLFGVEIRPWANAPVWHESVEAFEMYDGGRLIGRFFLDMHPREGKFNHAAQFPIRIGSRDGSAAPMGALVCNFPTGLMEHDQVETFLHEFGHLIHSIFAGQQRWAQLNYGEIENDFIEAPSTFLEEWVWDYDTLAQFARNTEGETIPRALVERMNAARNFGKPEATLIQVAYAAVSLNFYDRDPTGIDFEALYADLYGRYAVAPLAPDTHHYAQFGHLTDYSAIVYTYEWSQSIALDLFTEFERNGIRDRATAMRYRHQVLAPGGSRPAQQLIETFLGRPWTLDAYRRRLAE